MNEMPLVSIIVTTRNRSELLQKCLTSVICQTYKKLEIIVVDDASSDQTHDVIKAFQKIDNRILTLATKHPMGANVCRNKAIRLSNGDYIAGIDDDDEFLHFRIETLIKEYDDSYAFITSNNLVVSDVETNWVSNIPRRVSIDQMMHNNIVMNQGLIEKKRIIAVGLYDEELTACQDYDMWMRLMLKYGDVKVLKQVTQIINQYQNVLRISTNSKTKKNGYLKFYKKYKQLMNKTERLTHLNRIYNIRKNLKNSHQLLIKIGVFHIQRLGLDSISVYGTGGVFEEMYHILTAKNIQINCVVETYPTKTYTSYGHFIEKIEDALGRGERNFIIASLIFYDEIKEIILEQSQKLGLSGINIL
jgi:glycosyltransferase involved in cell wall biosynthesis